MGTARGVLLAGAIAAATGCDLVTGPADADVVLEVVDTRAAGPDEPAFVIEFSVENRGEDTAYITPRCGAFVTPLVYVRQGEGWSFVGGGFCTTDRAMHPWPLQPGESVSGSTGWRDTGTYQLRIGAADREGENPVWVRSGDFRLEL